MENILNLIVNALNAENGRLLVTLVCGFSGFVWLKTSFDKKIDKVEYSLNKRIDDLKYNDFAHLNNAMEALIFTLERNGSITDKDKEYIGTRLTHP